MVNNTATAANQQTIRHTSARLSPRGSPPRELSLLSVSHFWGPVHLDLSQVSSLPETHLVQVNGMTVYLMVLDNSLGNVPIDALPPP